MTNTSNFYFIIRKIFSKRQTYENFSRIWLMNLGTFGFVCYNIAQNFECIDVGAKLHNELSSDVIRDRPTVDLDNRTEINVWKILHLILQKSVTALPLYAYINNTNTTTPNNFYNGIRNCKCKEDVFFRFETILCGQFVT